MEWLHLLSFLFKDAISNGGGVRGIRGGGAEVGGADAVLIDVIREAPVWKRKIKLRLNWLRLKRIFNYNVGIKVIFIRLEFKLIDLESGNSTYFGCIARRLCRLGPQGGPWKQTCRSERGRSGPTRRASVGTSRRLLVRLFEFGRPFQAPIRVTWGPSEEK